MRQLSLLSQFMAWGENFSDMIHLFDTSPFSSKEFDEFNINKTFKKEVWLDSYVTIVDLCVFNTNFFINYSRIIHTKFLVCY